MFLVPHNLPNRGLAPVSHAETKRGPVLSSTTLLRKPWQASESASTRRHAGRWMRAITSQSDWHGVRILVVF